MKPISFLGIAPVVLLCFLAACGPGSSKKEKRILPDSDNGGILLPPNFGALVVADELGAGRHLVVRDNGDIYVHLRRLNDEGKGIVALRDTSGDGVADLVRGFSEVPGTGIRLHNGFLYYSSRTRIYRSPLSPDELLPEAQTDTLVKMVDGAGHMEKTFDFDGAGNMYVNIGSLSNACEEVLRTGHSPGVDPCTELETRAGIWKFSDQASNQQQDLSLRYATGIRNAVALTWNRQVGRLYGLQHGRDDLHRYWPEHYTEEQNLELPAEVFLDIGEGDDFGWPYCYYDQFRKRNMLAPEYGGTGQEAGRCSGVKAPLLAFPGHWGPNDLLFYQGNQFPEHYRHGAFIAFHGSWNRLGYEQAGFNVVFVPMKDGRPSGDWEIFADGFKGNRPINSSGDAMYRPCGLAEGPDGSLYVVDSQKGRVWRIMYYPEGLPEAGLSVVQQVPDTEVPGHGDAVALTGRMASGKAVYDTYCSACHMPNGKGAPGMNPPLTGTDWVLGDKDRLIRVILNGLNEPVEIQGEIYQNIMAAHAFLTDQQVADVLTYVRGSFGNDAGEILPEEVARVRSAR
jgi:glucose/arabinose dehydrogenase